MAGASVTAEGDATLLAALSTAAREAPDSGIYEVFHRGLGRDDLIRLWVGEGDVPTPAFIADAAARSLSAGETFYTFQRGVPERRAALAAYHRRLHGRAFDPDRFFVTGSGMQAMQIAVRLVAGEGDEVVVPTPTWPNIIAAVSVAGARPVTVPLDFTDAGWRLDVERLLAAVGPRTRALFVNTPANPTGWTASDDDIRASLDFADRRGLWIVADEVYHRFTYGGRAAPVVLRSRRAGRACPLRQHVLEELGDDRLARRLAVGAAGAGPGDREPHPVFDHRGSGVHAARGDRGAGRGRGFRRRAGCAGACRARPDHGAILGQRRHPVRTDRRHLLPDVRGRRRSGRARRCAVPFRCRRVSRSSR